MKSSKFIIFTSLAIGSGFIVGMALGKATRSNINTNTTTEYKDGVVIIKSDIRKSLRDGASSLISDLFN